MMAEIRATIQVGDEVIRLVEAKIKKTLQPLWKVEQILTELIDEYQPPEPYWTPILELHTLVCQILTENEMQPE